jgi:hypothetical protein
MRKWIRLVWTAAIVMALAWPLLFWSKAASLDRKSGENLQRPSSYNPLERHEILW